MVVIQCKWNGVLFAQIFKTFSSKLYSVYTKVWLRANINKICVNYHEKDWIHARMCTHFIQQPIMHYLSVNLKWSDVCYTCTVCTSIGFKRTHSTVLEYNLVPHVELHIHMQ